MLTMLFILLVLSFTGHMIGLAFRMTWGLIKIIFAIIFLPVLLIGLLIAGLVHFVIPILLVAGIISLIKSGSYKL